MRIYMYTVRLVDSRLCVEKKTICTYHLSLPPAQVIKESYDGGKDEH